MKVACQCSKLRAMEETVRDAEASGKPEAAQARRYASAQQGHTGQSLPTTFLPTPAPHLDQRRIRDFTTTSHLEVSAGNQAFSKQVRSPLLRICHSGHRAMRLGRPPYKTFTLNCLHLVREVSILYTKLC